MAKFCIQCGTQVEEGTRFCPGCGKMVEEPQPPAPPPQYAPPPQQPQPAPQYAPPQPPPPQPQYAPPPPQYAPPQPAYAGAPAASAKKKFPKWLIVVIIVAAAIITAVILANSLLGDAANKDYFTIGRDKVPSVKLILGEARSISSSTSSASGGVEEMIVKYEVLKNQNSEMLAYANALMTDYGYINTTDYNFNSPTGRGLQFAAKSVEEGYIVIVQIDYDKSGYTLTFTRGKGTLTANDGPAEGIDKPVSGGDGPASGGDGPPVGGDDPVSGGDGPSPGNGGPSSSDGGPPAALPGSPDVFDFTALSEEVFPRGMWTVNELAAKYQAPGIYGILDEATGYYDTDYMAVWSRVRFENAAVFFAPSSADNFSFVEDPSQSGDYELNGRDRDFRLEVASVRIFAPSLQLPHGIKLLKSTKADVMGIYPVDPPQTYSYDEEDFFVDVIGYKYAFPGSGNDSIGLVDYFFDRNGVLEMVDVSWWMMDL